MFMSPKYFTMSIEAGRANRGHVNRNVKLFA